MDRRTFLGAAAGSLLAAPLTATAQQPHKVPIVGFLASGGGESLPQFRDTMRDLGYVEGQSFVLESRSAEGRPVALRNLAAELVRLNVDVLYVTGPPAARAARDATSIIPIVVLDLESDPVASGLVRSLGRPGGNVTGLFLDLPSLAGKWLGLLRETVSGPLRVGLMWDSTTGTGQLNAASAAARQLDVDLQILEFRSIDDYEAALRSGVNAGVTAIVMLSSPIVSTNANRFAALTVRNRLPAIAPFRAFADGGGLMSYGPDLLVFRRIAAAYVDKILKGAKPADLPVQQPAKFEFIINLKSAKVLGISVPQSVLLRADEVIR